MQMFNKAVQYASQIADATNSPEEVAAKTASPLDLVVHVCDAPHCMSRVRRVLTIRICRDSHLVHGTMADVGKGVLVLRLPRWEMLHSKMAI